MKTLELHYPMIQVLIKSYNVCQFVFFFSNLVYLLEAVTNSLTLWTFQESAVDFQEIEEALVLIKVSH